MFKQLLCVIAVTTISVPVHAADQTPADKAIAKAIADLEATRDTLKDPIDQAKIDKAVRELEAVLGMKKQNPQPAPLAFEVTPAALKKKFGGKAIYNAKTGELTLMYDFSLKAQVADFDVTDQKVVVAKKVMFIDAGDNLTHKAKFKSFTIATFINIKGMRNIGISSTNGSHLGSGGQNPDTLYMNVPGGGNASKIVPDKARSGTIPIALSVTPSKTSVRWADERLAAPTVRKEDIHQITLYAGVEGCAYSNMVIVGVPDPVWFKEFLTAE